jgi:hypothetical protein
MAKPGKRGHYEVDTYEVDDFVEDDEGSAPKSKKSKKTAKPSSSKSENKFFEVGLRSVNGLATLQANSISSSHLAKILDALRLLNLKT